MKNKYFISAILLAVIIVAALYSFRANSGKSTIKIGVIAPMSGQYGFLGESFKKAIDMAVANDSRFQVVFEDDQFDAKRGLSAYQKLVTIDKVDLILNESSPTLDVIAPLAEKAGIPVIQIFETRDHKKDNVFQMLPFSYTLMSELGKLATSRYSKIAIMYSGATEVLELDKQYFETGATAAKIVDVEKVSNDSDIRTAVTKALSKNPDAITNIFVLNDGIKFIKELNAQRGNRKVSLVCDVNTEFAIADYIKALGTSTFEGCISTNMPNMTSDDFKSAYRLRYGSEPVIGADWGYDAITVAKQLVGVPKEKWTEAIQRSSFDGVSGHVSFDETGTRPGASEDHVFKDGKFVKID